MTYTYPLRADSLRPADHGTVIDIGDGIAGRLTAVNHSPLGTTLLLEGVHHAVFSFRGDLIGVDRDTWRRLKADADRRIACTEGVFQQEQNEAHRAVITRHVDQFQKVISEGWDLPWGPGE